jgi:hypothetical protein
VASGTIAPRFTGRLFKVMQVRHIQVGWKWLEGVLNRMIGAINGNEPLDGSGIRIVDTSNGKLISVAAETSSQNASGGGGGAQTQQGVTVPVTIQAFDANNNPVMLTVMTDGSGFGTSTLQWQPITVVDPSTCVQSTKPLLGKASQ